MLSGGLDSATCLAIARDDGFRCRTLAIDYGQRHRHELDAAEAVAAAGGSEDHLVVRVDLRAIGGSALTDDGIDVPRHERVEEIGGGIPVTYVPARNLIFLSLALAKAEAVGAAAISLGVNAIDYSGYPDCRPAFVESFRRTAGLATRVGVEERPVEIRTPLVEMTKPEIIRRGADLGVDYGLTHSCYAPDDLGRACGRCDSCLLRRAGFERAGVPDPTRYAPGVM